MPKENLTIALAYVMEQQPWGRDGHDVLSAG